MPPRDASIYLISYLPTDRHSTRLIAFDVAISSQYLFDLLIGFLWIHNDVHANRLSARIWVARSLHVVSLILIWTNGTLFDVSVS